MDIDIEIEQLKPVLGLRFAIYTLVNPVFLHRFYKQETEYQIPVK